MSTEPVEILAIAKMLLANSNEIKKADGDSCEPSCRSAASRAYYAALHAVSHAIPDDLAPPNPTHSTTSHKDILDAVTLWSKAPRNGRTEAGLISKALVRLRKLRKAADYQLDDEFTELQANEAIQVAERTLIQALRACDRAAT